MRKEVVAHGQYLYQVKWTLREKINNAETVAELNEIDIKFDSDNTTS